MVTGVNGSSTLAAGGAYCTQQAAGAPCASTDKNAVFKKRDVLKKRDKKRDGKMRLPPPNSLNHALREPES